MPTKPNHLPKHCTFELFSFLTLKMLVYVGGHVTWDASYSIWCALRRRASHSYKPANPETARASGPALSREAAVEQDLCESISSVPPASNTCANYVKVNLYFSTLSTWCISSFIKLNCIYNALGELCDTAYFSTNRKVLCFNLRCVSQGQYVQALA